MRADYRSETKSGFPGAIFYAINMAGNFVAGLTTGYSLEKAGRPISNLDSAMILVVPSTVAAIEDRLTHGAYRNDILGSTLCSASTFPIGDLLGRKLAHLF